MFKFKLKKQEFHPHLLVGKYFISEMGNYIKIYGVDNPNYKDYSYEGKLYEKYIIKYSFLDSRTKEIKVNTASFYSIHNRITEGYIKFVNEDEVPSSLRTWEYST